MTKIYLKILYIVETVESETIHTICYLITIWLHYNCIQYYYRILLLALSCTVIFLPRKSPIFGTTLIVYLDPGSRFSLVNSHRSSLTLTGWMSFSLCSLKKMSKFSALECHSIFIILPLPVCLTSFKSTMPGTVWNKLKNQRMLLLIAALP